MRKKSIEEDLGTLPTVASSNRLSRFLPSCKFPWTVYLTNWIKACNFILKSSFTFNIPFSDSIPGIQRRRHQQRDPEAAREGARHRGRGAQGRGVRRDPFSFQPVSIQLLSLITRICLCAVAGHPRCSNQRPARQLQQRGEEVAGGEWNVMWRGDVL